MDAEFMTLRDAFLSSPVYRDIETLLAGRRPPPESTAKRHHFVPALTLRHFAARDDPDRLVQLELETGRTLRVRIDEAASRRRFYTLTEPDGARQQRLEAWLAEVEGHAAEAITRLLADPVSVSRVDAATISMFVAMLSVRTPAAIRAQAAHADAAMRIKLATRLSDPEAFAVEHDADEAVRQRALQGLRDGSIAVPDEHRLGLQKGFDGLGSAAQLVFQLRWTLLRAREGRFITSDRALAMFDASPPWPWTGNEFNSSPAAQTTVPLTATDCLLLEPSDPWAGRAVRAVGAGVVDAVNLRTYGWADRHVFSDSQEAVASVRRVARNQPRRVPRPRPMRQVLVFAAEPGDDRLAKHHARRGWPRQVAVRGVPHDYVVLDENAHPAEASVEVAKIVRRRAAGRGGRVMVEPVPVVDRG